MHCIATLDRYLHAAIESLGIPLLKSRHAHVDPEFRSFLLDYAESGVFPERSAEVRIIRAVAHRGLGVLGFQEREVWYEKILPVLGKPLSEQVAVSAILRNGGRVPPRVGGPDEASDDLHPFSLAHDLGSLSEAPDEADTDADLLLRITRELRRKSRRASKPEPSFPPCTKATGDQGLS